MAQRILVINDTQDILDLFRELLEEEGYEVMLSGAAFRNVSEVKRIKPDLIILDYVFGGERTGWQMLQMLKMERATAEIPIIICTAATREVRDIETDLTAKGVRLIHKPFDIDDLLGTVSEELEARRTNAHLVDRTTAQEDDAGGGNRKSSSHKTSS